MSKSVSHKVSYDQKEFYNDSPRDSFINSVLKFLTINEIENLKVFLIIVIISGTFQYVSSRSTKTNKITKDDTKLTQ